MRVTVITPPAAVISTEQAKSHLRYVSSDQDALIDGLIAAATSWIDGPAGWLGRAIGQQEIEAVLDEFCDPVHLPSPPVMAIDEVAYLDEDGASQVLSSDVYGLDGRKLYLRSGQSWPAISGDRGSVTIRYTAGYPEGEVPAAIVQALLLLVGHWFANREAVVVGQTPGEVPLAVEALLQPFRVWT